MLDATKSKEVLNYVRPKSSTKLSKSDRENLLTEYFQYYQTISSTEPVLLNQKLPRDVFKELLDLLGGILLCEAKDLAVRPGAVRDFLEINKLPPSLARLLPPEFRVFCLALNALKQWVSAEQQATDRFLLGGNARNELRAVTGRCVVMGKSLENGCELHHPVRDGRPPIPLCHEAHDKIEQQESKIGELSDPNLLIISKIRSKNNNSWKNLRRGCLDLMGVKVQHSTSSVGSGSRTFARNASKATGLSFMEIIDILDSHDLGVD